MKRRRLSGWGWLYKLHRYIGLAVALIVLMLAVTGILINHSDSLQLSKRRVKSAFILDQYGIKAPGNPRGFKIDDLWVIQMGKQLFLDNTPIPGDFGPLAGVVATQELIACGFPQRILLLSPNGDVVEHINTAPRPIQKIGIGPNDDLHLMTPEGNFSSDDMLFSWHPANGEAVRWTRSETPPSELTASIKQSYRSNILPLDRVLLDIHSGRFFGPWGVYVIDAASVLLIFLAISGAMIWLRHKFVSIRAHYRKRKGVRSTLSDNKQ